MAKARSIVGWRILTYAISIPAGIATRRAVARIWTTVGPGNPPRVTFRPERHPEGGHRLDDDLRGRGGRGRERDDAGGRRGLAKPDRRGAAPSPHS